MKRAIVQGFEIFLIGVNVLFYVLSFSLPVALFGQDPYHKVFNVADGLPSDEVYDIEVDSLNQIWITTDRGLCVYDGYNFEILTTKDGLGDNTNFEIFVDNNGRMWLTGYNSTLSYREDGEFKTYEYLEELKSLFAGNGNYFRDIWQDGIGAFYVVAHRPIEPIVAKFVFGEKPILLNYEVDMDLLDKKAKTGQNLYWEETPVNFYRGTNGSLKSAPAYETDKYFFYRGAVGLVRKDKISGKIEQYPILSSIEYIHLDARNDLWVCTDNGLYRFKEGDFKRTPEHYFIGQAISSVRRDLEGGVWLSTNESGVYYVPSFDFRDSPKVAEVDRKENYISLKSFKDRLIIGTTDSRVISLQENGTADGFKLSENAGRHVSNLNLSRDGQALLLTGGYGLIEKAGSFSIVKKKSSDEYTYGRVTLELRNGSTISNKLPGYRFLNDTGDLLYDSQRDEFAGNKNSVNFFQDRDGRIWVGALEGLFIIENYQYNQLIEVTFNEKPIGRTSDVKSDTQENIWVGTIGNGLFHISAKDTLNISQANGLRSNMINQLLVTSDSTILAAGNAGINRIVYHSADGKVSVKSIEHISSSDGLTSDYVNAIEYWNGKIWAATNKGICYFDEREFKSNCSNLPTSIKFVSVNGVNQDTKQTLQLNHQQNDVHLGFVCSSHRNSSAQDKYEYRLSSDDGDAGTDWISTSSTEVRFSDLDHGDYSFEVRRADHCEGKLNRSDVFNFEIAPHFSDTSWFKLLLTLVILALLIFAVLFARRRFRNIATEERKFRETEFRLQNAELNSLRNQMNPHFVFNSLNSIQNFIFKNDVKNANHFISKLSQLMRESLQYTRLDFITLKEEIDFLKNYILLESMRFPDLFDFEVEMEKRVAAEVDNLQVPSLLLQPILENAIKHGFKNIDYKGNVVLRVHQSADNLLNFEIVDNGPGIEPKVDSNTKVKNTNRSVWKLYEAD